MGIVDKIHNTLNEADEGRYECPNCHSTTDVTSSLMGTTMHCDECGEDHPHSERVKLYRRSEGWEEHDDEATKLAANSMGDSVTRESLLETVKHGSKDGQTIMDLLDTDEEPHYLLLGLSVDVQGGGDSNAITGNDRSTKMGTTGKVTTVLTDKRIIVYIP